MRHFHHGTGDTMTDGTADLVELHALCSRYMSYSSRNASDRWLDVFKVLRGNAIRMLDLDRV